MATSYLEILYYKGDENINTTDGCSPNWEGHKKVNNSPNCI